MKVAQSQRQYLSSTSLISGVGLSEYLKKGWPLQALFHCFVGSGHIMVPNQWCFANLLFYLALRVTNSSNSSWPDLLKINWDYTLLCGEEDYHANNNLSSSRSLTTDANSSVFMKKPIMFKIVPKSINTDCDYYDFGWHWKVKGKEFQIHKGTRKQRILWSGWP